MHSLACKMIMTRFYTHARWKQTNKQTNTWKNSYNENVPTNLAFRRVTGCNKLELNCTKERPLSHTSVGSSTICNLYKKLDITEKLKRYDEERIKVSDKYSFSDSTRGYYKMITAIAETFRKKAYRGAGCSNSWHRGTKLTTWTVSRISWSKSVSKSST